MSTTVCVAVYLFTEGGTSLLNAQAKRMKCCIRCYFFPVSIGEAANSVIV